LSFRISARNAVTNGKRLIISQAPSLKSDPKKPWSVGFCSKRLWGWFGCDSRDALIKDFDLFHAIPYFPGRRERKGDFVVTGAEKDKIKKRVFSKLRRGKYELVFLVGRFVQSLLSDFKGDLILYSIGNFNCKFINIPHPSGVNVSINGRDGEIREKICRIIK